MGKMEDIQAFRERKVKAKTIFAIRKIDKKLAYDFVVRYHYLGDAKFFAVESFGLFMKSDDEMVGVAAYSLPQGNVALKGWFGLDNSNKNIYELSRLCMLPILNGSNATSFLLGGSLKILKKENYCRAVTTLACSTRHVGSIYQVCNFKYYGLTDKKCDFYRFDGICNPRGATKHVRGVWVPRPLKHRYCYLIDKTLKVLYEECERPCTSQLTVNDCCGGKYKVHDKRFDEWYTCPHCTGRLVQIGGETVVDEKFIDCLLSEHINPKTKKPFIKRLNLFGEIVYE